jgi:hypothetical protein
VRFSEEDATNSSSDISELLLSDHGHPEIPTVLEPDILHTAATPWIALVACDANATDASQETDIFTLANERGAVGAVRIFFPWQTLEQLFIILPELSSSTRNGQARVLSIPGTVTPTLSQS